MCSLLYSVKLVVASSSDNHASYVSAVNDTQTDTLYLHNGEKVIGDYDYETRGAVVMYHAETGKRTKVKKQMAEKLVLADGKVVKYELKKKKEYTNLQKFGIVVGIAVGAVGLLIGGLMLIIYIAYNKV